MGLRDMGIQLPVITLGKEGCIAALSDGVYRFFAPPIKVLNTVGSGDSFTAGCAVALSRGEEPDRIIRLGMGCGMANTQFFKTGMVSVELVEQFYRTIEAEKIM